MPRCTAGQIRLRGQDGNKDCISPVNFNPLSMTGPALLLIPVLTTPISNAFAEKAWIRTQDGNILKYFH